MLPLLPIYYLYKIVSLCYVYLCSYGGYNGPLLVFSYKYPNQ